MATIRINNQDVEVTEEFKKVYEQMKREDEYADRRYRRYNHSLEATLDKGHDFEDTTNQDDEELRKQEYKVLHEAISQLNDIDRFIVEEIYFNNKPKGEVAKALGWSISNLSHHLRVIYKKIKKIFVQIFKFGDFADL